MSTRAFYCGQCAEGYQGINFWARRDDGITICYEIDVEPEQLSDKIKELDELGTEFHFARFLADNLI